MICEHCGQEIKPTLSIEEYEKRAIPRLKRLDLMWDRIQRENIPSYDPFYERYMRLNEEQGRDEVAAGL